VSKTEYLLQIKVAATAAELHEITRCAATDKALSPAEYITVRGEVGKKFAALNAAAAGNRTLEYRSPVRIPTAQRCH
jgi:hypothetical protein